MAGKSKRENKQQRLDIDLWIDLPARQHMRPVNIAIGLGARMMRNTIVELSDGTLVNFIYAVDGLGAFVTELRRSVLLRFQGCEIPVMPLESIRKSKAAILREKDHAHIYIFYLDQTLRLRREQRTKRKPSKAGPAL